MIRTALAATVVLGALVTPARAAAPLTGDGCTELSVAQGGSTTYNGAMSGVVAAPGSAVSLRCSIHVGNASHTGPAVATATVSGAGSSVAVAGPATITYDAESWDLVALCSEATVDGTDWYYDGAAWSADPAVPCPVLRNVGGGACFDVLWCVFGLIPPGTIPPELEPYVDWLECQLYWGIECSYGGIDHFLCPQLAALQTQVPGVLETRDDGDLYVAGEFFWDCPPYEPA
jgi:hypothetical protein